LERVAGAAIIALEAEMVMLNERNVQFVIGKKGKPTGVLVNLRTWEKIIEALEDAEDIEIARKALAEIDAAGGDLQKAGYIPWSKARSDLEKPNAQE
jgi:PHD/YefM family antitoxin component YafN of YafNO toxin-antitoxin module